LPVASSFSSSFFLLFFSLIAVVFTNIYLHFHQYFACLSELALLLYTHSDELPSKFESFFVCAHTHTHTASSLHRRHPFCHDFRGLNLLVFCLCMPPSLCLCLCPFIYLPVSPSFSRFSPASFYLSFSFLYLTLKLFFCPFDRTYSCYFFSSQARLVVTSCFLLVFFARIRPK
jgi:hypothetical protein